MKLVCPHCKTGNKIEYADHIKCEQCNQSFKGYTYKIKAISKPILVTALVSGAIISQSIEYVFEENRYPLEIEYALISNCISPYSSRETCTCALQKTMNKISYNDLDSAVGQKNFKKVFREKKEECRK